MRVVHLMVAYIGPVAVAICNAMRGIVCFRNAFIIINANISITITVAQSEFNNNVHKITSRAERD